MKKVFFICSILLAQYTIAQNVGIGTNTPGFPLNFSNAIGDKISLYGNSGQHYGFGVQNALMQVHSDIPNSNIAFGYGSSTSFTERMRIINAGEYGMHVNGRILLRNGTIPLNTTYGPGIWFTKPDNTATLGFIGVQNNQNLGFYGGPAGWGFVYDAVNSRIGIGTPTPNAPLSFPALLGKKITFYPGAQGDVGIGIYGNEFRIHTDYPQADITFGYENTGGAFTERMRVRGNGALVINGNSGSGGEVLQTNGANTPATWVSATNSLYNNMNTYNLAQTFTLGGIWDNDYNFPGLTQTFNFAKPAKVLISYSWHTKSDNVVGDVRAEYKLFVDNVLYLNELVTITPGQSDVGESGTRLVSLPAGQHTFRLAVKNFGSLKYYGSDWNNFPTSMTVIIVSQ